MTRWFPANVVQVHRAAFLDVILYSREQIIQEYQALPAQGKHPSEDIPNAPWGIISIKAQDEPHETPMNPITMLRNALGKEQGGSGVPLDRQKYEEAVAYWDTHAAVL